MQESRKMTYAKKKTARPAAAAKIEPLKAEAPLAVIGAVG
jgi:hypothetical protein